MKGGKTWARRKERGDMRWDRTPPCLTLQLKDNKVVTMLTTIHNANDQVVIKHKEKQNRKWESIDVKKPKVIQTYNAYINGVDKLDQILSTHNLQSKCVQWWKTLFFHLINITTVNSFTIFQECQKAEPNIDGLQKPANYSLLSFREELVRNILELEEYSNSPVYRIFKQKDLTVFNTVHIPVFSKTKRNCKVCYAQTKKECKVLSYHSATQ